MYTASKVHKNVRKAGMARSNLSPPAFMDNQTASPSTASLNPPPPSLIALPSMSHSLSALPTMTSLPDMLHYGTFGGGPTRDISEAKVRTIALHIVAD
jgi:hypothetical protein